MQHTFFPDGDDLPLFSGAPVRAEQRPFTPQPVAEQPSLIDLSFRFGEVEQQYLPAQLEQAEETITHG